LKQAVIDWLLWILWFNAESVNGCNSYFLDLTQSTRIPDFERGIQVVGIHFVSPFAIMPSQLSSFQIDLPTLNLHKKAFLSEDSNSLCARMMSVSLDARAVPTGSLPSPYGNQLLMLAMPYS
jgi:hypothetical protein